MVALSSSRQIKRRTGDRFTDPVKTAVSIQKGALVVLDGGYAAPGRTAAGLKARGVAEDYVDNASGANGAKTVEVMKGVYSFINDGSVLRTHIGGTAYIVDDQTVAATDGAGARSAAGEIIDVDADGVWIKL